MNIVGIIPARMASSRLPNKPMADILGLPMIGHCYYRSKMSPILSDVYVATCDQEIYDFIVNIGGKAVMTSDSHERASDRTAEAMLKIETSTKSKIDIVVLLQGDEPMTTPQMIELAVTPLVEDRDVKISNLYTEIKTIAEFENPNEVKVVIDNAGFALYFSREPIPSRKKGFMDVPMYKQVCVIPFKRDYLIKYNAMSPTILETVESVDMMRVLEHGDKVKMVYMREENYSVDTEEDLSKVIDMMRHDKLLHKYLNR